MPQEDKDKIKVLSKNLFPVVGIGASAGGLEAFKKLVKAIPENSGMAYILVQHLHPDHSSSLPEILQRETKIPVQEISDNVIVKPDNVYIIPSNNMLVATDGILQLSPRPSKDQKNMPIDVFFSSLAEVHQSHAIGIVLSGTGVDGTQGLKNIKAHGGLTFAEDLDSAAYGGMPQSAINAEVVDFILTPEKMPQQLLELNRTYKILSSKDVSTPEELSDEQNFRQVLSLLRTRSGVDFTYYKQTTVRRRILRRMIILKRERIIDYLDYLKQNNSEQDNLFRDIL
jgi:two-component system CheB/CheR fusion protein